MQSNKEIKSSPPQEMELEVTCYLSRRDSGSRTSCYTGEAFLTKQFSIEIAVSGAHERNCTPLSTTVCRKCREVLLQEFSLMMPCLRREERRQQVDFLLKHRPRDKTSSFRVVALFDGRSRELCLPREEESCPLCKFALSPFDRASSLSEQSLSRGYSPSPPSTHRETLRTQYRTGDAPFAAQVTPQGEVIPRKPRPVCARQDFVSPSDLQVKPRGSPEAGLHRHVSLTVSNFKYSPLSHSFPRRTKSSCQTHRTRTSYVEEDCLQTLKKGLLQRHRPRTSPSLNLHEYSTMHSSQPAHVKACRVM